ncbi:hypothetical protein JK207_16235 [Gluconobacter cerinus]|uniref:hypothetical protein n=1 Tax=Gluconobacter cerinus TaxID=38307 RepID=UPI001B8B8782|nr:hypothetical protein [Gluconobacter cerinus]MBS1023534.1 hypothetical protein [Gluconobacter cerinus]
MQVFIKNKKFKNLLLKDGDVINGEKIVGKYKKHSEEILISWSDSTESTYMVDGSFLIDIKDLTVNKNKIKTFDIFDTLIARRCFHPDNIFVAVEKTTKFENFFTIRKQAEYNLINKGDYDLYDIYEEFQKISCINDEKKKSLLNEELNCEFNNIIPIKENLDKVGENDIIISDMYLPKDFLEKFLYEKCGLSGNYIYLSSSDKKSGMVWSKIKNYFDIECHLGDNAHSDIHMANENGIKGEITYSFHFNDEERFISSLGYEKIALISREMRLAFWEKDDLYKNIYLYQFGKNIPLLIVISIKIIALVKERGINNILFSSRDCFFLYKIFNKICEIYNCDLKTEYFYTSRICRSMPSEDYINYCNYIIKDYNTLIVDLCGTGWSLKNLLSSLNKEIPVYFPLYINSPNVVSEYNKYINNNDKDIEIIFSTETGNNVILESANSAPFNMCVDVFEINNKFVPSFNSENNYDKNIEKYFNICIDKYIDKMNFLERADVEYYINLNNDHSIEKLIENINGKYSFIDYLSGHQYVDNSILYNKMEKWKKNY